VDAHTMLLSPLTTGLMHSDTAPPRLRRESRDRARPRCTTLTLVLSGIAIRCAAVATTFNRSVCVVEQLTEHVLT
jgi:hypothetical protein